VWNEMAKSTKSGVALTVGTEYIVRITQKGGQRMTVKRCQTSSSQSSVAKQPGIQKKGHAHTEDAAVVKTISDASAHLSAAAPEKTSSEDGAAASQESMVEALVDAFLSTKDAQKRQEIWHKNVLTLPKKEQDRFTDLVQHGDGGGNSVTSAITSHALPQRMLKSKCTDSCKYAKDNSCDDGGDDATYSVCELGTDCSDCGERSSSKTGRNGLKKRGMKRNRRIPPASRNAGALCSNDCKYARDGACDDGGDLGSQFAMCALGTDCADCGSRSSSGQRAAAAASTSMATFKKIGTVAPEHVTDTIEAPNFKELPFFNTMRIHATPFRAQGTDGFMSADMWDDDSQGFVYVGDSAARGVGRASVSSSTKPPKSSWTTTKEGGVVVSAKGDEEDKMESLLHGSEDFKFHTAKTGETLAGVCQRYGTPRSVFLLWNGDLVMKAKRAYGAARNNNGLIAGETYLVGMAGMPSEDSTSSPTARKSQRNGDSSSRRISSSSSSNVDRRVAAPILVKIDVGASVFAQWSIPKSTEKNTRRYRWIRGKVERKLDGLFLIHPSSVDAGEPQWLSVDKLSNVVPMPSAESHGARVFVMARDDSTVGVFEGRVIGTALAEVGVNKKKRFKVSYSTDEGKTEKQSVMPGEFVYKFRAPFFRDDARVTLATRAISIQSLSLMKDALEPVPFWISGESERRWKVACDVQHLVVADGGSKDGGLILIGIHYLDFDEGKLLKRLKSRGFKVTIESGNKEGVVQRYIFSRPFYCNNLLLGESVVHEIDRRSVDELLDCKHSERRLNTVNVRIRLSVFFQGVNGGIADGTSTGKDTMSYGEGMRLVWVDVEGRRFRAPRNDML
jgi:hypothetical protein